MCSLLIQMLTDFGLLTMFAYYRQYCLEHSCPCLLGTYRNARMAAEKRYSDTLKALGLSEEFVTEKGRGGKVSENVTRQEPRSHVSDKESSYEEERENEGENSFLDDNSQDSCKENTEDVNGSREENSQE
ncbi:hypothetical protein STEG23_012421 [Scotinomys teguina]